MLDEAIELASGNGAREVVVGMAHRGRLNVLAHTVGRPYETVLAEFEGEQTLGVETAAPEGGTGDVKYHYGAWGTYRTQGGKGVTVTLSPNPSHLEYVNPVIEGRARADQTTRKARELTHDPSAVLPVLIHGDAAFPGQGIVAETLNLQSIPGYSTGGTLHVIANNQLGFTTDPDESRSTRYASDLAKGFDVPIIHVNADDVESCVAAIRLALAYRETFGRDALVDLIGYRRFGHNETDEPAYTQPLMYERIKEPSAGAPALRRQAGRRGHGDRDGGRVDRRRPPTSAVADAHEELKRTIGAPPETGEHELDRTMSREPRTTLPEETVRALNEQLLRVPDDFEVHRKLRPFLERRRTSFEEGEGVDWAHAEALAFASLLALGRAGAAHRPGHRARHVQPAPRRDARPAHRRRAGARSRSCATPWRPSSCTTARCRSRRCVGFEYGYSVQAPDALVLWEAQFGDFVNSAQVIVDQFLVSGLAKWGQTSRLTLLLPHGYEGSGPEHSSARLERFLQAAAEGNIRVANCHHARPVLPPAATPGAGVQAAAADRDDAEEPAAAAGGDVHGGRAGRGPVRARDRRSALRRRRGRGAVTKLVLCSGKVYYDIAGHEERDSAPHIAVVRVEQLYPFPEVELAELMASYPNLERVVWVQEEPRNMGARAYMRRRMASILPERLAYDYVGRQLRAAPGEGYSAAHKREQSRIVRVALDLEHDRLEPDASSRRPYLEPAAGEPALAFRALARGQRVGQLSEPSLRWAPATRWGRGPRPARRAACREGPRRSRPGSVLTARTTASATASGGRLPTPGGSFTPDSANMPAPWTNPGNTTLTPTPVPIRSSRRPPAKPRRPNLVAE